VNRAHSPEHIDMKSAYAEFRDNPDSVAAACCWLTPDIGQCGGDLVAGARSQADHAAQPSALSVSRTRAAMARKKREMLTQSLAVAEPALAGFTHRMCVHRGGYELRASPHTVCQLPGPPRAAQSSGRRK
jgi:hypothetical protein